LLVSFVTLDVKLYRDPENIFDIKLSDHRVVKLN